jgi:hypothetical protein
MDRDKNFIGYTPSEAAKKKKVTAAATQGLVIHKLVVPFSVTILLNVYIFF